MEYVSKITMSGLKMMVKSGPAKFILKSLYLKKNVFITEFVILDTLWSKEK